MCRALPPAFVLGDDVSAPRWPHRTYRRRLVTAAGAVTGIAQHALVLSTPQGVFTVKAAEARRES
jgi:hypothetical protein